MPDELNTPAFFDRMFAASDDPWQFKVRWYEQRKRALTLACLPKPRYASGYEPGCANGELSAELATRCDRLLISDGAQGAVELARCRVADLAHVTVDRRWLPEDWPDVHFDLIVLSEVLYYLDPDGLDRLGRLLRAALEAGADIVACHWRMPIQGCRLDGDGVHAVLAGLLDRPASWALADPDFRLDVWSQEQRSVATLEGLRPVA